MDTFQSYIYIFIIYRCISLYLHPYQPWLSTVRPFSKNSETQKTCLSWWLWGRSPTPWKGWQCPATCCATRCCRRWSYCGWSRRCSWRIVPRWVSPRSRDFMGKLWEHSGKSWDIDKWRFMGNSTILIVAELWYLTVIFPNGKSTTWGICRDFLGWGSSKSKVIWRKHGLTNKPTIYWRWNGEMDILGTISTTTYINRLKMMASIGWIIPN